MNLILMIVASITKTLILIGLVIDGQHRIEGFKLAYALYGANILKNYPIVVKTFSSSVRG